MAVDHARTAGPVERDIEQVIDCFLCFSLIALWLIMFGSQRKDHDRRLVGFGILFCGF